MSDERLYFVDRHPACVSGRYLRELFDAIGVPWGDTTLTVIRPPDSLEVTYALRDEDGKLRRAGNEVASVTVRIHIDWATD